MAALLTIAAIAPAHAQEMNASSALVRQEKSSLSTTTQPAESQASDQMHAQARTERTGGNPSSLIRPANSYESNSALLSTDAYENTWGRAPKHFLLDQKAMWTSPAHIRLPEATWLVPLGGFAAGLFATDTDASRHLN